jgi:hypothetical protein
MFLGGCADQTGTTFFFLEKAVLCLYDYGVGLGDVDRDWSSEFGRESV